MVGGVQGISLLPCPELAEHHIHGSWDKYSCDAKAAQGIFPILEVPGRCRSHLMSCCRIIPFTLAELRKAKPVKFVGLCIDSFVSMGGTGRDGDTCACGNSHAIGNREWVQSETAHDYREKVGRANQRFVLGPQRKESNKRRVTSRPSTRWVSCKKLFILCILSIVAFVQPSSATTASTSWRKGSISVYS
jgi:hypothetical protein